MSFFIDYYLYIVTETLKLYSMTLNANQRDRCKRTLQCPKCSRSYAQWKSLLQHMNYFCQVEPLFLCPFCNHRARLLTLLKYHLIKKHQFPSTHNIAMFK